VCHYGVTYVSQPACWNRTGISTIATTPWQWQRGGGGDGVRDDVNRNGNTSTQARHSNIPAPVMLLNRSATLANMPMSFAPNPSIDLLDDVGDSMAYNQNQNQNQNQKQATPMTRTNDNNE
jgi:hypothetical protein